jgi:hypothetical protein
MKHFISILVQNLLVYGVDGQAVSVWFPPVISKYFVPGPTLFIIQWVPGALFLGAKPPRRETSSTVFYSLMAWYSIKHKNNLTYTLPSHTEFQKFHQLVTKIKCRFKNQKRRDRHFFLLILCTHIQLLKGSSLEVRRTEREAGHLRLLVPSFKKERSCISTFSSFHVLQGKIAFTWSLIL